MPWNGPQAPDRPTWPVQHGHHALAPEVMNAPRMEQDALIDLVSSLAAPAQPAEGLRALDVALQRSVGHKLFTVLVLNLEKDESQRHYSSRPVAYPTGGTKPIQRDSEGVVLTGRARLCVNYDDCRRAFFDHELIHSLGCESAINVPVRWNGETLGSLNLLHQAGWYTLQMLPELSVYAALAVPLLQQIVTSRRKPI